jgi:hypothetical protein
MDQLTHQVDRHHLPYLIHRFHPEQPRHDLWVLVFNTDNQLTLERSFLKERVYM